MKCGSLPVIDLWISRGIRNEALFPLYMHQQVLPFIFNLTVEVFMTTDKSEGFKETFGISCVWLKLNLDFLDRRLADVHLLGKITGDVSEYLNFTAHAIKNIANSRGMWF